MEVGEWGTSRDGQAFYGTYATKEEAIEEHEEGETLVGQYSHPTAPELFIDGDDLLEKVLCQDEYQSDFADGTLDCTGEQLEELTAAVRKAFGDWIDRHGLRPEFLVVKDAEPIILGLGD